LGLLVFFLCYEMNYITLLDTLLESFLFYLFLIFPAPKIFTFHNLSFLFLNLVLVDKYVNMVVE